MCTYGYEVHSSDRCRAETLVQWLKLPAWKVEDRGFEPQSGIQFSKKTKCFFPAHSYRLNIVGSLRDRDVACSASDRQGSNFAFCVWRVVSSHSSHHLQEVLLAQFSLDVHKCGLKPYSFHFISNRCTLHNRVSIAFTQFFNNADEYIYI